MTKLTFEKIEALKELSNLKKSMEVFSKKVIIEVLCHEITESFHALAKEDEKYWLKAVDAFGYLLHVMEEKVKKEIKNG